MKRSLPFSMVFLICGGARAERLSYFEPTPSYVLERTVTSLSLTTPTYNFQMTIKPCNREAVDSFWKQALTEFRRQPLIQRAPGSGTYAQLDEQLRLVTRGGDLEHLDRSFMGLMALDKKQCKS